MRPTLPFSQATVASNCLLDVPPGRKPSLGRGPGLHGVLSTSGSSCLFVGRSQGLKPPISAEVGATQAGREGPKLSTAWPGRLRLRGVMYGPLALPGSDSRWMGSAEGGLRARREQRGGGAWLWRRPFPEGRPPGRTGRTGVVLGAAPARRPLVRVSAGRRWALGSSWRLSRPRRPHL